MPPCRADKILLTIFAIPKPFLDRHIEIIQRNAIKSWVSLGESVEVLLLGNDAGTAEIAAEFDLKHIPEIQRNRFHTPTVSSLFQQAQEVARGSCLAYVNADIILTREIFPLLKLISFKKFLLTCQRVDLEVTEELDFTAAAWESELRQQAAIHGQPFGPLGMDLFIFPRGMYQDMPPFGIGRACWDNWLIFSTRSRRIPVIDATPTMTIVHQKHDYSHHPEGWEGVYLGVERDYNLELAGGWDHIFTLGDADWIIGPRGLKRLPRTKKSLRQRLDRIPVLHPSWTRVMKAGSRLRQLPSLIWGVPRGIKRILRGALNQVGYDIHRLTEPAPPLAEPAPPTVIGTPAAEGARQALEDPQAWSDFTQEYSRRLMDLGVDKAHYGCGPRLFGEGWVNLDRVPSSPDPDKVYLSVDLVSKLPFPSDFFSFAFAEDFLEHLDQAESMIFLAEAFRTLKPDGILRLSFPGLRGVLKKHYRSSDYEGAAAGQQEAYTEWEHKHFYCEESLTLVARHIGFSEVQYLTYGESKYKELCDLDYRDSQKNLNIYAELKK
jgi:predicted SAM-dependent methyltransferase